MDLQRMTLRQRNALQIHGTQQRYDRHLQAKQIRKNLYKPNIHIYTDSLKQRIDRNRAELDKLRQLIRQNKVDGEILEFNAISCFYPSYILDHHFNHFSKIVLDCRLHQLAKKCANIDLLGVVLDQTVHLEFQKTRKTMLVDGRISMQNNTFFYSLKTHPYIDIACFQAKRDQQKILVFVKVRQQNGELSKGVTMRDMGSTISSDYCCMGYRFDGVQPITVLPISGAKVFKKIGSYHALSQLNYSMQDLMCSLHLTVKYTSLRKQFATLEKSKQERRIIEYQAVAGRIIDGFASLYMLSFLRQKMLTMPGVATFMQFYMPIIQQIILPRIIQLRECCGGFGYLQISGHPALIQRVALRSAQPFSTFIPQNPELMKRIFYYASDEKLEEEYIKNSNNNPTDLAIFSILCIRMKKRKQQMAKQVYVREFITQVCIQLMSRSLAFTPISKSNGFEHLLSYIQISYILENSRYIDLAVFGKDPVQFVSQMMDKRTKLIISLQNEIPEMLATLQSFCSPNVIEGSNDSEKFYEKVYEAAKTNERNAEHYRKFLQEPLVTLMKEQRAKL